ncbi:MAG: hypothetical protein WA087_02105 [Candidatus Saccharimonadales bacterium]
MPKFEFAVCPKDEEDLPSGHKRKKRGDIIAVKPAPWEWGIEEQKRYLIVVVDNLTQEEADELCEPLYEDDAKPKDFETKTPISKRKFSMNIDNIITNIKADIDTNRLEDFTDSYQPLKDNELEIDAKNVKNNFDFINNKHTKEDYIKTKKK